MNLIIRLLIIIIPLSISAESLDAVSGVVISPNAGKVYIKNGVDTKYKVQYETSDGLFGYQIAISRNNKISIFSGDAEREILIDMVEGTSEVNEGEFASCYVSDNVYFYWVRLDKEYALYKVDRSSNATTKITIQSRPALRCETHRDWVSWFDRKNKELLSYNIKSGWIDRNTFEGSNSVVRLGDSLFLLALPKKGYVFFDSSNRQNQDIIKGQYFHIGQNNDYLFFQRPRLSFNFSSFLQEKFDLYAYDIKAQKLALIKKKVGSLNLPRRYW